MLRHIVAAYALVGLVYLDPWLDFSDVTCVLLIFASALFANAAVKHHS